MRNMKILFNHKDVYSFRDIENKRDGFSRKVFNACSKGQLATYYVMIQQTTYYGRTYSIAKFILRIFSLESRSVSVFSLTCILIRPTVWLCRSANYLTLLAIKQKIEQKDQSTTNIRDESFVFKQSKSFDVVSSIENIKIQEKVNALGRLKKYKRTAIGIKPKKTSNVSKSVKKLTEALTVIQWLTATKIR